VRADTVYVGNVGEDAAGAFLDVACGDTPIKVGDGLHSEHGGSRLEVFVERIELYGQEFQILEAGLTGRLWVRPRAVSHFFVKGTLLAVSKAVP